MSKDSIYSTALENEMAFKLQKLDAKILELDAERNNLLKEIITNQETIKCKDEVIKALSDKLTIAKESVNDFRADYIKANTKCNNATKDIDSLKSILFNKELEIAKLQGRIEATSTLAETEYKRSTPVLQVPREVFESLNRIPQYPGGGYTDGASVARGYGSWWNIGKEE